MSTAAHMHNCLKIPVSLKYENKKFAFNVHKMKIVNKSLLAALVT